MTKFSKSISVVLVALAVFSVAACEIGHPNPGYQTFGTQPYPANDDGPGNHH